MTAAELITIMEAAVRLGCRVTVSPDGTAEVEPIHSTPEPAPARSAGAERTRRYRERQAAMDLSAPSQSVTGRHKASPPPSQSVTTASQGVTDRHKPSRNVTGTETTPSPSPSLPTPLPSPPTSPQGKGVRTCAKEPEPNDWLEDFEIPEPEPKAETPAPPEPKPKRTAPAADPEAIAVTLPDTASDALREAWAEWQEYRQRRAAAKLSADRIAWTGQAARNSASQMISHAARLGERIVCDRVASAIAGEWRGLNLDKLETPKQHDQPHFRSHIPNRNGTSQPLPQAEGLNRNRLPPKLPRP